jgi:hypothetical protein
MPLAEEAQEERDMPDFTLRLPEDIDELVKAEAQENRRSKHQQILTILADHFSMGTSALEPTKEKQSKELETAAA